MSLKKVHDDFIKTIGDGSPSYSTVKKWAAEFRRGRVEVYEWSGHPKESTADENIELVHSLIMCDRRRSLPDIARLIGMFWVSFQSVLTDILRMSKVSAKWVHRMLTKDQKKNRLDISNISCLSTRMILRNLCVESWPKLKFGFSTLILRPKSRVCNGSTLAHPS